MCIRDRIQAIQTTQASLVVADSRLVQAVLLGFVSAVAVVLLGMLLYYVLDDRILVASDVKQVTDVPFVGYVFEDVAERLRQDYDSAIAYLQEKHGKILEINVSLTEEIAAEQFAKAREADGIIVILPYGKIHGTYLSYLIGLYQVQGCNIVGIAITDADVKFIRKYYGRAI